MRPRKVDYHELAELRKLGHSFRYIANILGSSPKYLSKIAIRYKIKKGKKKGP